MYDIWKAVLEMARTVASGACIKELKEQSIVVVVINCKNSHIGTPYILQTVLM